MIQLISCGSKYGAAPDSDLYIDATLFPNPPPALRNRNGLDPLIREHVLFDDPLVLPLLNAYLTNLRLMDSLSETINVVVVCTSGKHRSVAAVDWLAWNLINAVGISLDQLTVVHRDLEGGL